MEVTFCGCSYEVNFQGQFWTFPQAKLVLDSVYSTCILTENSLTFHGMKSTDVIKRITAELHLAAPVSGFWYRSCGLTLSQVTGVLEQDRAIVNVINNTHVLSGAVACHACMTYTMPTPGVKMYEWWIRLAWSASSCVFLSSWGCQVWYNFCLFCFNQNLCSSTVCGKLSYSQRNCIDVLTDRWTVSLNM